MLSLNAATEAEQESIGGRLAGIAPAACIIYIQGDLGAGKTTFVRGFLRGLGYPGAVKSPTYTLIEPYEVEGQRIFHLDLYRLADPEELEYLGLRDVLDGEAQLLIEWPEQGGAELPPADLKIRIRYQDRGRVLQFIPLTPVGEKVTEDLARESRI